tara:strand:+ start:266 stop:1372 length:1107 start_codon:yes stop_codon:yes gene_type:complete
MQKLSLGIVGAGVMGKMVGLFALSRGHRVTYFDNNPILFDGTQEKIIPCSLVAAGMLSPFCELEKADLIISKLGEDSLPLWEGISKDFDGSFYFDRKGGIVVSHPEDKNEVFNLLRKLKQHNLRHVCEEVSKIKLNSLEPDLSSSFMEALYFPNEGHVDPLSFQKAFVEKIIPQCDECHFNTEVLDIGPHKIETNKGHYSFDYVIDCRGLGANKDLGSLRGVRGEVIKVQAPGVKISRPVRLMHPRYQIYVVPRPEDCYLIGATSLESEDFSPVSVRSALELLSALYSLNSSFSEARILEMNVQCRPAFTNNNPKIIFSKGGGLIRVNGLYRHGYLISPKLAEVLLDRMIGNLESHSPFFECCSWEDL